MSARDLGLAVAAFALLLDQLSKLLLLFGFGFIDPQVTHVIPVLPFFNIIMVWNSGVSYGLLAATSTWGRIALIVLALAAVTGLGYWLWRTTSRSLAIGLGLVIGGAIGNNLIDRVIYGKVADFFHFYGFGYDWYVFNVADVAITFGAIGLMYDVLKPEPQTGTGA